MLDLILEPAGKYACCLKDVRIYRPAEGAASDHHQVTALVNLPGNGGRQTTVQVRTRTQWISGAVAESIRSNPTAYQCELSTELGVEDEKSFEAIVNAIGKSAKPIGSAMSKTQRNHGTRNQTKPWNPSLRLVRRHGKCTYGTRKNSSNSTKR